MRLSKREAAFIEAVVVRSFIDKYTWELHKVGEHFICSQTRFDEIENVGHFVDKYSDVYGVTTSTTINDYLEVKDQKTKTVNSYLEVDAESEITE